MAFRRGSEARGAARAWLGGRLGHGSGAARGAARRARAWLRGSVGARVVPAARTVIWSSRGHSSAFREHVVDDAIPIERHEAWPGLRIDPQSRHLRTAGVIWQRSRDERPPDARLSHSLDAETSERADAASTNARAGRGSAVARGGWHIRSTRAPLQGRGVRPGEQRLEHRRGETAGECVLLARVIRPEHDVRPDDRLRAVPEPWPRADGVAVSPEDAQDSIPPEGAEGDDDADPRQERQLSLEERETSVALVDRRSVRGRCTADRRGDVDAAKGEAVVRPTR